MAPSLELEDSGWAWGAFTGICRQDAGFAKGLYAHEGSQMAFLRGDPRKSKIKRKGPQHMCVGYITGLKPGEKITRDRNNQNILAQANLLLIPRPVGFSQVSM